MPLTISVPDTLRRAVESASGGRNTGLYTAKGQPCHMVVVPKFTLESIDPGLGSGTHPAFIVGGVERAQLFIGQHIGVARNAEMLSLPGVDPINSIAFDAAVSLVRANGLGWHLMTNVEYAALALWCWRNGYQPRGNTAYGRSSDLSTEVGVRQDGVEPGTASGNARTLTGSGPASWRHDNTPFGIADLNGNVWEWSPGMRVVAGEIHVIENNDAAAAVADLSATSAAWKAIDGATGGLITPTFTGSIAGGDYAPTTPNSVRYALSGTANYTLVRASGSSFEGMTNPGATPVGATALQVLRRHGLFPVASTGLGGDGFWIDVTGERLPIRGGSWNIAASSGVFALYLNFVRSSVSSSVGARPAFVL